MSHADSGFTMLRNRTYAKDAVGFDAFSNPAARMGAGTSSLAEATEYELVRWSNNYWLMITLFRNHWISRRIVEKPAQDMVKAWPRLNCNLKPEEISSFDRTIARTYTPSRIKKALTWARLFGGAGALMVIKGHEEMLEQPLDLDDINPGSYKGLIVFDRWSGITPGIELSDDIDRPADFGLPKHYEVKLNSSGETLRVHHSRILRFNGPEVPNPEHQAQLHWGISELEVVFEELRKRDNMSWSILQLIFRAQILAQKNPALDQLLSGLGASTTAAVKFQQRMQAQNELLSNNSMLILPAEGSLESHQYAFGGVSEIYSQFQMDIAGAARIPVSILFGRTVSGIGQSNDADIRIYENEIGQKQHEELKPQLDKLYPVICMSEFGEVPDDLDYIFPSIRVLTEEEKGKIATDRVTAVTTPYQAGAYSQKVYLQELAALQDDTGMFTNITPEVIEAADDETVSLSEQSSNATEDDEVNGKGMDAEFNEADHPRDEEGRFATSEHIASKLGYSITKHETLDSYSKTPGFAKGTAGYTDSTRKEIHVVTEGKPQWYVNHYINHEVGHTVDYDYRKVDSFDKAKVAFHKHAKELKEIGKVFKTDYTFKSASRTRQYQNSVSEVMAEAFAMYQENPERLRKMAPAVFAEMRSHVNSILDR